ncbi:Uncharacterised protein [Vibrio cholerae]|uniref:Uncharacterized protein n=1 Tax=Vibrio cholerae TaxID=666 RepID=A0A655YBS9_VIBCL|nr:Uncharacterised protein [Vibrio cholerae]
MIPKLWHISVFDLAVHQIPFDFKTQDHMGWVGEFIGIDADKIFLHARVKFLNVFHSEDRIIHRRKMFACQFSEMGNKRRATTHLHLKEQRL